MLKSKILKLIKNSEKISRIEISKILGISPATVGKIVSSLLDEKLIIETTLDESTGGRKAILLKINEKYFGKILGIYFAPKDIYISVGDISGNIFFTTCQKISTKGEDIFWQPEKLVRELLEKYKDIEIISLVLNGLVDSKNGILIFSPHYNLKNFDIKEKFESKFNKKIFLENDVRSMAITEKIFGSCKENHNFVVLNIEDGVGGSIYLNDKLYHGYDSISGELGHMTVKRDSLEKCLCGKRGCLETEVSNRAIVKKIVTKIKTQNQYSSLKKVLEKNKVITIEDVIKSFVQKDMLSLNVLGDAIYYIAYAIDMIISIINPEKIILFGDIFECPQILDLLRKETRKITMDEQNYKMEVSGFLKSIYTISPFATVNYQLF